MQGCRGAEQWEVTQPLAVVLEPTGELLCGALGDGTLAQQPHLAKGVRGYAQGCTGVLGYARVCTGVQGDARVCKGVQGCARGCEGCARVCEGRARVCEGVRGVCKGCTRGVRGCARGCTCVRVCAGVCNGGLAAAPLHPEGEPLDPRAARRLRADGEHILARLRRPRRHHSWLVTRAHRLQPHRRHLH